MDHFQNHFMFIEVVSPARVQLSVELRGSQRTIRILSDISPPTHQHHRSLANFIDWHSPLPEIPITPFNVIVDSSSRFYTQKNTLHNTQKVLIKKVAQSPLLAQIIRQKSDTITIVLSPRRVSIRSPASRVSTLSWRTRESSRVGLKRDDFCENYSALRFAYIFFFIHIYSTCWMYVEGQPRPCLGIFGQSARQRCSDWAESSW